MSKEIGEHNVENLLSISLNQSDSFSSLQAESGPIADWERTYVSPCI